MSWRDELPRRGDRRIAIRATPDAVRQLRGGSPWLYDGSIRSVSHDGAAGDLGVTPGHHLANVDSVDVTIHGRGGHGARPQETVDPIVTAAQVVTALQTLVSRRLDPLDSGVVTVGAIHGGTKHNVIPDQVTLQLTVRSFDADARRTLLDGIAEERQVLSDIRERADNVIDTSELNVHDLARQVRAVVAGDADEHLRVNVTSFGFKYGIPLDADHVVDVRFLANPYWVSELRHLTGRDAPVRDWPSAARCDRGAFAVWHQALLAAGVYWPPSQFEAAFVSAAHDEEALAATLSAAKIAFAAARAHATRE